MSGFIKEALRGEPKIIMSGQSEISVENSEGIFEVTRESVTLKTALGALIICGKDLMILKAEPDFAAISGRIDSVSFA